MITVRIGLGLATSTSSSPTHREHYPRQPGDLTTFKAEDPRSTGTVSSYVFRDEGTNTPRQSETENEKVLRSDDDAR